MSSLSCKCAGTHTHTVRCDVQCILHVPCFPSIIFFEFRRFSPASLFSTSLFHLCFDMTASIFEGNSIYLAIAEKLLMMMLLLLPLTVPFFFFLLLSLFSFGCITKEFDCFLPLLIVWQIRFFFSKRRTHIQNSLYLYLSVSFFSLPFSLYFEKWLTQNKKHYVHMNDKENFCYFSFISCLQCFP